MIKFKRRPSFAFTKDLFDQVFKLLASNRLANDALDASAHLYAEIPSVIDRLPMRTPVLVSHDATREISGGNFFDGIPVKTSNRPSTA